MLQLPRRLLQSGLFVEIRFLPNSGFPISGQFSFGSLIPFLSLIRKDRMNLSNLSDFSDSQFDVYKWINTSIDLMGNSEDLDSFLSGLSMKIQVLSQDCGDSIESQMSSLLNRLPDMVGQNIYKSRTDGGSCGVGRKNGRSEKRHQGNE